MCAVRCVWDSRASISKKLFVSLSIKKVSAFICFFRWWEESESNKWWWLWQEERLFVSTYITSVLLDSVWKLQKLSSISASNHKCSPSITFFVNQINTDLKINLARFARKIVKNKQFLTEFQTLCRVPFTWKRQGAFWR